jgi:hypothetical protein
MARMLPLLGVALVGMVIGAGLEGIVSKRCDARTAPIHGAAFAWASSAS